MAVFGEKVATYVLVGRAIVLTGLVARRELLTYSASRPPQPVRVKDWDSLAAVGWNIGDERGELTIVEFSDFQCPYCKVFRSNIDSLLALYPGKLRIVYRHFPIDTIHPFARIAARASECAGVQGRFKALHDTLFSHQKKLDSLSWAKAATSAGVSDTAAFSACLTSDASAKRVSVDSAAAELIGLTGTPTVVINGWKMEVAPTMSATRELIDRELVKVRGKAR